LKKIKPVARLPNRTDQHVGSCVRLRRMALGKSQSWLANAVGLTFQQVQKYEKGTNRIGSSRLQQFANLLDVPISFFFDVRPVSHHEPRRKSQTLWSTACPSLSPPRTAWR
jgi:transcriptional regulator with XRE-family HTH domain